MTGFVKKGIALGYLLLLTLGTIAVSIYCSIQKPTSFIKEDSGLEGTLKQGLQQLANQNIQSKLQEGQPPQDEKNLREERVSVYETEGADFTLAFVVVEDEDKILEKVCGTFLQKLEVLSEEKMRVLVFYIHKEEKLAAIASLLPKSKADACVILDFGSSEDASRYGIEGYGNGDFYWERPSISSLCDSFVRNVAIQTRNRGEAYFELEDGDALTAYEIPAMKLILGYLSNEKEKALLCLEEYQEKVAEGLLQGIKEIYVLSHEE